MNSRVKNIKIILILTVFLFSFSGCKKDDPPTATTIYLGALLPLTGSGASVGESANAAIELAVVDINAEFKAAGKNVNINIFVEDTETNTEVALQKISSLKERGIQIIIGPFTSANVNAVMGYANSNDLLIVSPASVSTSLAIAGDNTFRLVPSDHNQGGATAALLQDDGIEVLLPLIRDDIWGNELLDAITQFSTSTVEDAIKYRTSVNDYTPYLDSLKNKLTGMLQQYPAEKIGVSLLSFGESVEILHDAAQDPLFNTVKWYGSSGFAGIGTLPQDTIAADFALTQDLSCPTFGLDNSTQNLWQPLLQRLEMLLDRTPEIYAFTTYDALWLAAETIIESDNSTNFSSLKQTFENIADTTLGVSGNTTLNDAGDRAYAAYDFWGITQTGEGYNWDVVARYNNENGILERY
jgi:branched-chain amino acid transport system substrate-binding protein